MSGWLVGLGIPPRFTKPLLFAAGLMLAIAAFMLWLHVHDRNTVSRAQDRAEAKAATIVRKADESASASRARDDDAIRSRTQDAIM